MIWFEGDNQIKSNLVLVVMENEILCIEEMFSLCSRLLLRLNYILTNTFFQFSFNLF